MSKVKTAKKLLANVDGFSSMTRLPRSTAARYLAKSKLTSLLLSFAAVIAVLLAYLYQQTLPVSQSSNDINFEIPNGASVRVIASQLKEQKLLRSPLYFRYLVKTNDLVLQAGNYKLNPSLTPLRLAQIMTKGLAVDVKLTIPEGFRSEQIAETATLTVKDFLVAAKGLEGELFPDTYYVKVGITAPELVQIMQENFAKKVGKIDKATLILASLVERETKGDAEKPIVAGILKKRLNEGWNLELDATVQYFLGKPDNWWPNTTLLDRKLPSPYNTYLHSGLPPAPIGNPGLASINAVRNSENSPYWFYLHDREGNIRYGATLEEHNQNIAKYIK